MQELIQERTLNTKTFELDNGQIEIRVYGAPVHFDKDGVLEEFDTNFYQNTTANPAYYLYNTINNTFRIGLTSDLSKDKAMKFSFRFDGLGDIYTSFKGMALYDSSLDQYTIFETPQTNNVIIDGAKATYPNVYNGVDVEYLSNRDEIKEYLYIKDRANIPDPTLYGYNPDTTYVIFVSKIETNGLDLQYSSEQLEVYNAGVHKLTSPKEWAKTAKGRELQIINSYNQQTNEYYFGIPYVRVMTVTLPITIDPTWNTQKSEDSSNYDICVRAESTDTNLANATFITDNGNSLAFGEAIVAGVAPDPKTGGGSPQINQSYYSLLRLAMPNNSSADLTSANFYINYNTNFDNRAQATTNMQVRKIASDWNLSTPAQTLYDTAKNATVVVDNATCGSPAYAVDITGTVAGWLNDPTSNHGLALYITGAGSALSGAGGFSAGFSLNNTISTNSQPYISLVGTFPVSGFKGSPITSTEIDWTWNASGGVDSFNIYDGNGVLKANVVGTATKWAESGLTPNTNYARVIKNVVGGVEDTKSTTTTCSTYPVLVAPTVLASTNVTYNSGTINWKDDVNQGVEGVYIYDKPNAIMHNDASINNNNHSPNLRSYSFSGLRYDTTYTYYIRVLRGNTTYYATEESVEVAINLQTSPRPVVADDNTVTIICDDIADAYTDQSQPTVNFGNSGEIKVAQGVSTDNKYAHIKFNLPSIDLTLRKLLSSAIELTTSAPPSPLSGSATSSMYYVMSRISQDWNETTITNNIKPTRGSNFTGGSIYISSLPQTADTRFSQGFSEIDTESWLGTSDSQYGIMISPYTGTAGTASSASFYSREATDPAKRPSLKIKHYPKLPPLPPSNFKITNNGNGTYTQSWNVSPTDYATGYKIYRVSDNGLVSNINDKSTTSNTVNGSIVDQYIVAYNNYGESTAVYSGVQPPTGGKGTALSASSVKWSFRDNGNDKYNVYRVTGGSTYTKLATIKRNGVAEVDTLTINSAPTASGNVGVILDGVRKDIAVSIGVAEVETMIVNSGVTNTSDPNFYINLNGTNFQVNGLSGKTTALDVANTIRGNTFTGWTTGGTGTTVTFTATSVGTKSTPSIGSNPAGISATISTTTTGTNPDTTSNVALKIANAINTTSNSWTAQASGSQVIFTALTNGAKTTSFDGGTIVTGSMVVTKAGVAGTDGTALWNSYLASDTGFTTAKDRASSPQFTETGLSQNTSYSTSFTTIENGTGTESKQSATVVASTLTIQTPTDLRGTATTHSVKWTFSDVGSTEYDLYKSGTPNTLVAIIKKNGSKFDAYQADGTTLIAGDSGVASPQWTEDNLIYNTSHDLAVVSKDVSTGQQSTMSAFVTVQTLNITSPTDLNGTNITTRSIKWIFTPLSFPQYKLYRNGTLQAVIRKNGSNFDTYGADGTTLISGGNTSPQYTENNLTPATSYNMTITSLDDVGQESVQSSVVTKTTLAINPPTMISGQALSSQVIKWTFTPTTISGVTQYKVYRVGTPNVLKVIVKQNGSVWDIYASDGTTLIASDSGVASPQWTESGLHQGTQYNIAISSYDGLNEGALSTTTYQTATAVTPPTGGKGTTLSSKRIKWEFTAGTYTKYNIYRDATLLAYIQANGTMWDTYLNGGVTPVESNATPQWTEINLLANTSYSVTFTSIDDISSESDKSAIITVSTYPLSPPSTKSGTALSNSEIKWTFTPLTFTEYKVYKRYDATTTTLKAIIRKSGSVWNTYTPNGVDLITSDSNMATPQWTETGLHQLNQSVVVFTSIDESDESIYSTETYATTLEVTAPTGTKGTPLTTSKIKWEFTAGIYDTYHIYRSGVLLAYIEKNGTMWDTYANGSYVNSYSSPQWTETGLTANTAYSTTFTSLEVNGDESQQSGVVNITTYQPLVDITSGSGASANYKTINWSWQDANNQGVTSYELLDKYKNKISSVNAPTKTISETSLRYSTTYTRYIKVVRYDETFVSTIAMQGTTPAIPSPTTETFTAVGDTTNSLGATTTNYGTNTLVTAGMPSSTGEFQGLVKFNLSALQHRKILGAKLRLYANAQGGTTAPLLDIFKVTSTWDEATVTWNTRPSRGTTSLGQVKATTLSMYYEINLQYDQLQSWIDVGDNYGLVLKENGTTVGYTQFQSRENTFKPELTLTHQDTQLPPTPPGVLYSTISSETSITWAWDASSATNIIGYRLYNADNDQLICDVPSTTTSYEQTGLVKGQTYTCYVVAYNTYGESSASSDSQLFLLSPPTNIVGTPQSSSRILWAFDRNEHKEYRVYNYNVATLETIRIGRVIYDGANFNAYHESNLTTPIGTYATPQFLQSGLLPNSTYNIKVSTFEGFEGELSNYVSAKTNILPQFSNFSGNKIGLNNLKWIIS